MGERKFPEVYTLDDTREYIACRVRGAELKVEYSPKDHQYRTRPYVYIERAEEYLSTYGDYRRRLKLSALYGGRNMGFDIEEFPAIKADVIFIDYLKNTVLERYRDIIDGIYMEGKSVKEVSEITGKSADTVTKLVRKVICLYADELLKRDILDGIEFESDAIFTEEMSINKEDTVEEFKSILDEQFLLTDFSFSFLVDEDSIFNNYFKQKRKRISRA